MLLEFLSDTEGMIRYSYAFFLPHLADKSCKGSPAGRYGSNFEDASHGFFDK